MTQIKRVEAFIRGKILDNIVVGDKPQVYVWEIQQWGVGVPNMSSGSAERHARTLRKQGILTHPTENGVVNKHAYILIKKEVEKYPTIPSHKEELQEEIGCERMDRKIEVLKQKSLF